MHDEPNYLAEKHDAGDCLEHIATLEEKIRKQGIEIARLQRENEDLKRDNKKLGELSYLLRMLNIARTSLARIVRMGSRGANGSVLADAISIAQQAERNIIAEEREMLKYHPVDVATLPEIDTY